MSQPYDPERQPQTGFVYLPGTPAFAEAIALLTNSAQAARLQQMRADSASPDEVARIHDLLARESTWSEVVFDGDAMVASAIAYPGEEPQRAHFDLLMVRPAYWGQGIASELINRTIAEFRSRGFTEIDLWTEANNKRSRALYQKEGWLLTGWQRLHPRSGELQVHYLRTL